MAIQELKSVPESGCFPLRAIRVNRCNSSLKEGYRPLTKEGQMFDA